MPHAGSALDRWIDVVAAVLVVVVFVRLLAMRNERLMERLAVEARLDGLTGLLNRRGLDDAKAFVERVCAAATVDVAVTLSGGASSALAPIDRAQLLDAADRSLYAPSTTTTRSPRSSSSRPRGRARAG